MTRWLVSLPVSVVTFLCSITGGSASSLRVGEPTLAPFAHTLFCQTYPRECAPRAGDLPSYTNERVVELDTINREINASIVFRSKNESEPIGRLWQVYPASGDCNDYAVTKRHYLLRRGWPSAALLLAEVVLVSGQHHLVLVVKMRDAAVVLDNLETKIISMQVASRLYRWNRIESEHHPKFWNDVATN